MTAKQAARLQAVFLWCDDHEKSTEFMLQAAAEFAEVEREVAVDWFALLVDAQWRMKSKGWRNFFRMHA